MLIIGQEEKAGAIKESEGEYREALEMYLRAGLATRASRLVQSRDDLLESSEVVGRVANSLLKGEFFEQAGELYERVGQDDQALECYRKASAYARAVELARRYDSIPILYCCILGFDYGKWKLWHQKLCTLLLN